MKEKLLRLHRDSLVRNSIYLMLSTVVMGGLGFFFWLICARLFSPSQIGIATTLISAMSLISYTSLLGFNSTFIRTLPKLNQRDNIINTGLILSNGASIIIAIVYVLLVPYFAPRLDVLHDNVWYAIGFILLVAMATTNLLTDSIFIAYRAAKYNLLIDGLIMSITKMLLPFLFVGLGAYGIFAASGAAASLAMISSIIFLVWKFGYKPRLRIHKTTLKDVMHYSFASYIANLLNIAPTLVIPLVVLDRLGSAAAGYYYLAFMVANLLYTVVYAVSQSLFAEGSYDDNSVHKLLKKSVAIIAGVLIPSSTALLIGAHFLLGIYGTHYSEQASSILRILALSAPAVGLYTISNVLLRIAKQTYSLIAINIVYFAVIAGLSLFWTSRGLTWVGYAWLIGNLTSGSLGLTLIILKRRGARQALAE